MKSNLIMDDCAICVFCWIGSLAVSFELKSREHMQRIRFIHLSTFYVPILKSDIWKISASMPNLMPFDLHIMLMQLEQCDQNHCRQQLNPQTPNMMRTQCYSKCSSIQVQIHNSVDCLLVYLMKRTMALNCLALLHCPPNRRCSAIQLLRRFLNICLNRSFLFYLFSWANETMIMWTNNCVTPIIVE